VAPQGVRGRHKHSVATDSKDQSQTADSATVVKSYCLTKAARATEGKSRQTIALCRPAGVTTSSGLNNGPVRARYQFLLPVPVGVQMTTWLMGSLLRSLQWPRRGLPEPDRSSNGSTGGAPKGRWRILVRGQF